MPITNKDRRSVTTTLHVHAIAVFFQQIIENCGFITAHSMIIDGDVIAFLAKTQVNRLQQIRQGIDTMKQWSEFLLVGKRKRGPHKNLTGIFLQGFHSYTSEILVNMWYITWNEAEDIAVSYCSLYPIACTGVTEFKSM